MRGGVRDRNKHEALEHLLGEIEASMLRGEADHARRLLELVEELLEPRWPVQAPRDGPSALGGPAKT